MEHNAQSFIDRNMGLIKLATIFFLAIMLLIPTAMIRSLVMERKTRQAEATTEIVSKWGNEQRITGPILAVPYYTYDLEKDNKKTNEQKHLAFFLPEELAINGSMLPEVRYRGIFQVAIYSANVNIEGSFKSPQLDVVGKNTVIDWRSAFLTVGISDLRGITDSISFAWSEKAIETEPGVLISDMVKSGITINGIFNAAPDGSDYSFSTNLSLKGSKTLSFVPLGKETSVSINSSWTNPSFDGAFLPASREITDDGFKATWRVLELNRNYPQKWSNRSINFDESAFGVSLLLAVDAYQITERSMKYAILFISLTFMVFFFVEILKKLKLHPIHYILVGFGLVLFYLLLLSLSEHIGFGLAYIIASVGIIVLITSYSHSIFKNNRLSLLLAGFLVILYSLLYILLQMQDYALLLGSVSLFIILALVMYLSRNVDWYSIGRRGEEELKD
jgi:inner membrane protein